MRIPPAHQRDDFEFRFFRGQCKQRGAVQNSGRERWAMIRPLNASHCFSQIAKVEEITGEYFGSRCLQSITSSITPAHECANGKSLFQEL